MKRSGITAREEANAITCWAFRNGVIEDLHAGNYSELLEDSSLSRITDAEMKKLMVESSAKMAKILELRDNDRDQYRKQIVFFVQYTTS